jgi:HAD superfamily hydrolase (TIGR01549 family)
MIEAVIFDIDGTIVDSVDLHARAWQAAFAKFGKEISLQKIRRQIGKGTDQLLPALLSSQAINAYGKELDEYRAELFNRDYLPRVKAFAKVRELFQRIKQDNKRIALASSAKADELEIYKKITRVEDLIESQTSSQDAAKSKPYPDIFETALQQLPRIDLDKVIVVGDTPYDAEAAVYKNPADLLAHYRASPLI